MTAFGNLVVWLLTLTVVFAVVIAAYSIFRATRLGEEFAIRASVGGWLIGGLVGALLFLGSILLAQYGSDDAVAGVLFALLAIVAAAVADMRRRRRASRTVTGEESDLSAEPGEWCGCGFWVPVSQAGGHDITAHNAAAELAAAKRKRARGQGA